MTDGHDAAPGTGPSRRALVVAGVVAAVVLLGFLGWRLALYLSEDTIVLKPQGVDPRDPFRGDYVILRYNETRLELPPLGASAADFPEQSAIYLVLVPGDVEHRVVRVARDQPSTSGDEVCMRGRVTSSYGTGVNVEYGIESYFVPEGRGLEAEKAIREGRALVHVKSGPGCVVAIDTLLIDGERWP